MKIKVVFLGTNGFVSKVSSRFEYFFLMFAPPSAFDAKLNSPSNGGTFKEGHREK
jgi:hypothetical protein